MTKPTIAEVANIIARHEVDALGPQARYNLASDIVEIFVGDNPEPADDLASALRDEIDMLRQEAAVEAKILEDSLVLKSFPKSRRSVHEAQIERLREIARGPL